MSILLLAACGSRVGTSSHPTTDRRATAATAAATPAPGEATSATESQATESTPDAEALEEVEAAKAASDEHRRYPKLEPGETRKLWGDMKLEVDLSPACATVGTTMRAVIRTVPDALIGAAVRYHDGEPHDDLTWGRAPTGEFVWTWAIKPGVPEGTAELFVAAGKSGEDGASTMAAFEVAKAC